MDQMRCPIRALLAGGIAFLAICMLVSGASAVSFSDDFNRPDGSVGNGWHDWWGAYPFDNGVTSLVNGEVRTYGYTSIAGGIFRELPVTFPLTFSFDFRTDSTTDVCNSPGNNNGGWLILFNTEQPSVQPYPPPYFSPSQVFFTQYYGAGFIRRVYKTSSGTDTDDAGPVPGQRDYQSAVKAHIVGVISRPERPVHHHL